MISTNIWAGFECGYLPWNGHDLLQSTRHTPQTKMREHYEILESHNVSFVRDGLVPGHSLIERLEAAKEYGLNVFWDCLHYHVIDDPFEWGKTIAYAQKSVNGNKEFWVCPQNEPSIVPLMRQGTSLEQAVWEGKEVLKGIRSILPDTKILHVDIPGSQDWFDCDLLGVNIYPHTVNERISDVLRRAKEHGKRVVVSETSWHDGFHQGYANKGEWLKHVVDECNLVDIYDICWYPIISCPPWDDKENDVRWSHGLIDGQLTVDESLSLEIKRLNNGY